jgi:hypothetical protein
MKKKTKAKRRIVELTEAEWKSLTFIVDNGWGDGDFEGYGGQNPKVQISAIEKLKNAKVKIIEP